jgi:hypothetical protein
MDSFGYSEGRYCKQCPQELEDQEHCLLNRSRGYQGSLRGHVHNGLESLIGKKKTISQAVKAKYVEDALTFVVDLP